MRHERGQTFFHTGSLPATPQTVHRLTIAKREGGTGERLWVESVAGLAALADIGVVEVHPWNATVDDLEHPDQMTFDLDPGCGIKRAFVTDGARVARLPEATRRACELAQGNRRQGAARDGAARPLAGSRPSSETCT